MLFIDLKNLGVVILGGSIIKIANRVPSHNSDGWDCIRIEWEPFKDYAKQSIMESKKYIKLCPNSDNIGYVLTLISENDSLKLKERIKIKSQHHEKSLKYF